MEKDEVLCAVIYKPIVIEQDEDVLWRDLEDSPVKIIKTYQIIPLIDHPHSDKENGQKEVHYHADMRYSGEQPHLKGYYVEVSDIRPILGKYKLERLPLIRYIEEYRGKTPVSLIAKSKLKHNCIHKGKCPHRGFDLSNVEPVNGIITCPLHSLRFNAGTKKLIKGIPRKDR